MGQISIWRGIMYSLMVSSVVACVAYGLYWTYFGTCETEDCRITQKLALNALWVLGWPERSDKAPQIENLPTYQDACFGPTPQDASDYLGFVMTNKFIELCGSAYFGPHVTAVTRNELTRRFEEPPVCDATSKRQLSQKVLAAAATDARINCDCKRILLTEAPLDRIEFVFEKDGRDRFCKWAADTLKSGNFRDLFGRFFPKYPSGNYLG